MNDREICRFVNSKDIRQYLLETGYKFTTAEAAWLVYQCRSATLSEKYEAWEDIIKTMPDGPVKSFEYEKPYESIHKVLSDYAALLRNATKQFLAETPTTFYRYSLVYKDGSKDYENSMPYSSYDKCYSQLCEDISKEDEDITGVIRRSEIGSIYNITARFNHNFEIMDIDIPTDLCGPDYILLVFFDELWFHFPVPFKKGDIIYHPNEPRTCETGPVVMTGITPLKYEEDGKIHKDTTDMNVWGYFQSETNGTIYHEVTWNYMDFEYFPEEKLTGKKRILKALSNLVKEEIDIELFIHAYHLIILEETKNDLWPHGWYSDKGMKLAGLMD